MKNIETLKKKYFIDFDEEGKDGDIVAVDIDVAADNYDEFIKVLHYVKRNTDWGLLQFNSDLHKKFKKGMKVKVLPRFFEVNFRMAKMFRVKPGQTKTVKRVSRTYANWEVETTDGCLFRYDELEPI